MNKTCKRCGKNKNTSKFYKHAKMKDGREGVCKECKSAYNKSRLGLEKVKNNKCKWNQENMPRISSQARVWAKNNPEKRRAHSNLWNAITRGKTTRPKTCTRCGGGDNIQAHHADYSKPLHIEWLCASCHKYADQERRKK